MVLTTLLILPQRTIVSFAQTGNEQYLLTASPTYIQEGLNTNITVKINHGGINYTYSFRLDVTTPNNTVYSNNFVTKTSGLGTGSNYTKFWSDFAGANTNLTGAYPATLYDYIGNEIDVTGFIVGLTDKLQYLRSETVNIRGSGYKASETVLVDLKFAGASISGFPRNVTASGEGVVIDSWAIPSDASLGDFTVTLTNTTASGTVKPVADVQSFTVGGSCQVQTLNLANQPLANVIVEVYNSITGYSLGISQKTNETGWARFILGVRNCTFKAFWNDVEVGLINQTITEDVVLFFTLRLSNIKLTVKDEASALLPFIDLNLKYNYTDRNNSTFAATKSFTTNFTGSVQLQNVIANINYVIEASRYGFLFYTTLINNLSGGWNNITIIVPTYTMLVQVLDSKNASAEGLTVKAYEWSSGTSVPAQTSQPTDINGNTALSLSFGKYSLRLYYDTTFLNEVAVNLTQNPTSLIIHSDVYNIDLNVRVIDYFGQPIPNVSVMFQRKNDSDYAPQSKTTGSDGIALFNGIIGGDSQIHVSVGGSSEIRYLYLKGPTAEVVFKMDRYVVVVGYTLEISHFVTIVVLLITIISFIIALTYKKLPRLLQRRTTKK
jgi:hypothetical protein